MYVLVIVDHERGPAEGTFRDGDEGLHLGPVLVPSGCASPASPKDACLDRTWDTDRALLPLSP